MNANETGTQLWRNADYAMGKPDLQLKLGNVRVQKQPAKKRSTGFCDVEATVKNTSNEHESTSSHALGSEPVK